MRKINIHEAKTNLSRLAEEAEAGEEIIIAKAGKPKAKLGPIDQPKKKIIFGALKGKLHISGYFDDELPKNILDSFTKPE